MSSDKFPDRCLDAYPSIYRKDFLSGKYAFITGGGSGINFRIAEAFMRHGCSVAIVSRSLARVEHAARELNTSVGSRNGTQCLCYAMDVTDYEQVVSVMTRVLSRFGRIDILINGAAGNFLCPASDLSARAFNKVLQIDTVGTFHASKAVSELWMAQERQDSSAASSGSPSPNPGAARFNGGCIVNITATLQRTGTPLQVHSSAAKAAVDAMTRVLANEWGRFGIRVNGVAPGPIADTTGFDKLGGFLPKDMQERGLVKMPLRRYGSKKEIADSVLFMVSDAASYVTGETLVVDGSSWPSNNDMGALVISEPKWAKFIADMKPKSKGKPRSKL